MSTEQAISQKPAEAEELSSRHPGLTRFADEMRRNHPEISDQEIADLFEAWSR